VDRVGDSIRDKVGDSIRRSDPRLEGRHPHGPRPHRHGHRNERKSTPPRTQGWPPLFETHGSDFVFDHRSNMFYESQSDFFYDPKSRLYYSNKQQAYFRYTNSKYPPFEQVSQSASSTKEGQPRTVSNLPTNASSASPSTASKNEITVAVKSRSKSLSQSRDPSEETKAFSHERKNQLANIEKWTKKTNEVQISLKSRRYLARSTSEPPLGFEKRESRDREILESSLKESTSKYIAANQQLQTHKPTTAKRESRRSAAKSESRRSADPEESMVTKAVTHHSTTKFSSKTSSGKLICRLCMRKFITVEKLREHVQLSERHKAHLAKKEAEEAAAEEQKRPTVEPDVRSAHNVRQPATEYKDRALKRRLMYSDLMTSLPHRLGPSFLGGTNVKVRTAVVDPASTLGEHNVGNQLFKKMVSKANERGAAPIEPAVGTLAASLTNTLRQDWERIELLSQRHTSSQGAGNTTGLGLGTKTSPWEGLDPRFP
jgi:hypothetical protein